MRPSAARRAVRLIAFAVFLAAPILSALAADDSSSPPAAMVAQLGDPSYERRQEAVTRLLALGLEGVEPLRAGLASDDAEIRRRCRWLLEEVAARDFQRRRDAFCAEAEGANGHGLPGWDLYRQIAGSDANARLLYAEMLRSEPALLQAAFSESPEALSALNERMQTGVDYYTAYSDMDAEETSLDRGSLAALWLILALPLETQHASMLIHEPQFAPLMRDRRLGKPMQRLVGKWVLAADCEEECREQLAIAVQYHLPEGLSLAIRALRNPANAGTARLRVAAIITVASLGGKPYARLLADELGNKQEIDLYSDGTTAGKKFTMQVRDVALACLVSLTEQDHAAYGMPKAKAAVQQFLKGGPLNTGDPFGDAEQRAIGFSDNADREKAMQRWRDHAEQHPLPELPVDTAAPPTPPAELPSDATIPPDTESAVPTEPVDELGDALEDDDEESIEPTELAPLEPRWPIADRELVRRLGQARQLAADRRYAQAARLVDEVFAAAAQAVFVPDRKTPLIRSVRAEAEQVLAEWPAAGLRTYVGRYGAEAAEALAEAARARDEQLIEAVATRWFFTPAGAEASLLAATQALQRGDAFGAAQRLARLRRLSPDAARLEPALSLRLAACWLQLGERRAADRLFGELRAERPSLAAAIERLKGQFASGMQVEPPVVYSVELARRGATAGSVPLLLTDALPAPKVDDRIARIARRWQNEHRESYRAALPGLMPLVVGQTALFRTPTHLAAVDLATGTLRWETPLEDRLQHYLRLTPAREEPKRAGLGARLRGLFTGEAAPVAPIDAPAFRRGVLARLWHDGRFGNLSTDGHRVFGLEHLHFVLPGDYQRLVVDEKGERRFDAGASQAANVLTAYDIATGKLLWQAGGPNWHPQLAAFRSAGRLPVETDVDPSAPAVLHPARFDGVQFLGPPLPVADRLFVMADARGATYLLELKADDGSLQSSLMLAAREPLRHYSVETDDMVEDDWPLKGCGGCALADDLLVCHTGMGQFFGVDLATRAFRWAFPLTELEPEPDENDEGYIEPEFLVGMQRLPENQWLDCGAIVIDDRVLLTSPGRQTLDCLRLRDGELLWSAPRRDGLGIGGVQRGRVLLVDRGGLRCLRLADGKSAWPFERLALPDDTLPAGRGYISGGAFYLPLQPAAVLAVDIANGRWLRRHRGGASAPSGNLLAHGGGVLLQTVDGLFRCASLSESQQASLSALQDRPDDPDLLAQLGQVCTAAGEWSAAIAALRRAHELDPSANRQRQLTELLVDALRSDFEPFHLLAGEIGATLDPVHAELLRRETAMGLERAGRWQAAFAAYQSLAEGASSQAMDRVEAIRQVRRDRWLSARLAEVYAAAADADRVEFDRRVQAVWRDDERAADRHVQLVVYGWHRSSAAVRMELAAQAVTAGQPHRAEWHLAVAGEAGDAAVRRRATEQLARLQPPPAAEAWKGKPAKSSDSENPHVRTRYPIAVRGDALGAAPLFISYDGSDFLEGHDADGRRRWRVELPMAVDGGYFFDGHPSWTAWRLGRIVVVDLGGRVCAVDAAQADGAPLWCRQPELTDATAIDASEDAFADPESPPELPGGAPLRVALSRSAACFQIGTRLWAVDPLSGETLWTRDDLPAGCDLFGDDEALLVTPPDGETTIVLSPVDGGELGSCAAPPRDERLWTVGRRVVVWKMGVDRMELSLTDPWRQTTVWRRTFDAKAKTSLVDGQEAAVLEPSGRLSMVRLGDGRDRAVVDAGPSPNVQRIAVIAGSKRTILMLSTGPSNGLAIGMWGWTSEEPWQFDISGRVVAFDADGKRLWSTELSNQSTRRHQPADLPVLVFVANGQRKVWAASRPSCRLLCLDARTGETLHEERAKEYRETGTAIAADPDAGRLEISTSLGRVSFNFIDMPAEPPESAADENP